jgi:hypothetical protein
MPTLNGLSADKCDERNNCCRYQRCQQSDAEAVLSVSLLGQFIEGRNRLQGA